MISMQCYECKHYEGLHRCPAFDRKIPQEILSGQFVHDRPHIKQTNKEILFESSVPKERSLVEE